MFCAALAFVALARILSAWDCSAAAFRSALSRSRRAAPLVGLALLAGRPSSPRCRRRARLRSASRWNTLLTPASSRSVSWLITTRPPRNVRRNSRSQIDRVGVQVVGRLVQQQRVRAAEQDPGQLDPPPLPAGQRAQRLLQHPVRQPEAGRDRRGLGLGGVAAEHGQPLLELPVPAHRRVARWPGSASAIAPRPRAARRSTASRPRAGQDPVAGQRLEVAGPGVLRQVADRAAARAPCRPRAGPRPPAPGPAWSCRRRCGRPGRSCRPRRPGRSRRPSAAARQRAAQVTCRDHRGTRSHHRIFSYACGQQGQHFSPCTWVMASREERLHAHDFTRACGLLAKCFTAPQAGIQGPFYARATASPVPPAHRPPLSVAITAYRQHSVRDDRTSPVAT